MNSIFLYPFSTLNSISEFVVYNVHSELQKKKKCPIRKKFKFYYLGMYLCAIHTNRYLIILFSNLNNKVFFNIFNIGN